MALLLKGHYELYRVCLYLLCLPLAQEKAAESIESPKFIIRWPLMYITFKPILRRESQAVKAIMLEEKSATVFE